jgi:hypothetical protein
MLHYALFVLVLHNPQVVGEQQKNKEECKKKPTNGAIPHPPYFSFSHAHTQSDPFVSLLVGIEYLLAFQLTL